ESSNPVEDDQRAWVSPGRSFDLVPKLCVGTPFRVTPVSRSRGDFAACAKRSFADSALPNGVWERGTARKRAWVALGRSFGLGEMFECQLDGLELVAA